MIHLTMNFQTLKGISGQGTRTYPLFEMALPNREAMFYKNLRLFRDFAGKRGPLRGSRSENVEWSASACCFFQHPPFGKGGLRGISNPQIPPYPPFLKGGRRGYKKMFDTRYRQFFVDDDSLSAYMGIMCNVFSVQENVLSVMGKGAFVETGKTGRGN